MKKISKTITKKEFRKIRKLDHLFTKDTISLQDKKNWRTLEQLQYENYLRKLQNESSDSNDK